MIEILSRASCFVAIILMGIILRRVGYFAKEDFKVLSKIVIRITLTAAIINSFSGRTLEYSMFILTLMGLGFGVLLMIVGAVLAAPKGRKEQAFSLLNSTGCNIGNFVLPFAQNFLGPVGVMATSLFDVGNSMISLGGAYGIASAVADERKRFSIKPVLKALSRSVPFMTYLLMTLLGLLRLSLPAPVIELAGIIGNANAFLAMLMIGVGFQLEVNASQIAAILRILLPRYGLGLLFAVLSFCLLPFPLEYRQALVILFLSPVASAAPAYTAEMKGNYGLASAINSFSIVTSIILIVGALLIIL